MLLNKFKKIYSQRSTGKAKNRIKVIRKNEGGKCIPDRNVQIVLKSLARRHPRIKIYPSANYGDAVIN